LGSLERIAALGLILAGWWPVVPLLFLPRLGLMIYQGQAKINRTAVVCKVATSFISALLISLVLLSVPLPQLV
jgi:hypothetical protein